MSSLTRAAASSLRRSIAPMISVLTGPCEGKVSVIVSLWKRIAASVSTVEKTPQAPFQGSVLSSYFIPNTSRPLTYVSVQSLRELMSASTYSMSSDARLPNSLSSMSSAKFLLNSSLTSLPGSSVISIEPSASVTESGFSISISSAGSPMSINSGSPPSTG